MKHLTLSILGLTSILSLCAACGEEEPAGPNLIDPPDFFGAPDDQGFEPADFGQSDQRPEEDTTPEEDTRPDEDAAPDLAQDVTPDEPDVIIIEEDMEEPIDERRCRPEEGAGNTPFACSFYAHTDEGLYKIDPFHERFERVADAPDLLDIDTHPDGTLYGLGEDALYRFDGIDRWSRVAAVPSIDEATGLAIDRDGRAFVTAGAELWTVDLANGQRRKVGDLGGSWYSSGDCVINKDNSLFMSSKANNQPDTLVIIDAETGRATRFGDIGFSRVYGLTAGWGMMFGMTSAGELLSLDTGTASARLIKTFEGKRWYGAASNPAR
jgi:hypothetical protein